MNQKHLLRRVKSLLDKAAASGKPDEITLRHALKEGWFSDALAWLLDPKGDHGLGVRFLQEFLKAVARERCNPDREYERRATHLRWSYTPGPGQRSTILRLSNAASFREFYLAGRTKHSKHSDRYCDVVVLDLDSKDGLVLVIENKLFGTNSAGQLRDQLWGVEDKYSRARVREYVYLTLLGDKPTSIVEDELPILPRWVALSWKKSVLAILTTLVSNPKGRLGELMALLGWLKDLTDRTNSEPETVIQFIKCIHANTAVCLLFELNRLRRSGEWTQSTEGAHRLRLSHSSAPRRYLTLDLTTDCSIAIQSKLKKKALCDKLYLPFGAPARQVFNLMQITARDLYWIHFDKPTAFLAERYRRTKLSPPEEEFKPMLTFIAKRRFELQALLGVSRCCRDSDPGEAR